MKKEDLIDKVPSFLKEGDWVLSLGAGDINIIQEQIMERYRTCR